jgi:hypothetical protein
MNDFRARIEVAAVGLEAESSLEPNLLLRKLSSERTQSGKADMLRSRAHVKPDPTDIRYLTRHDVKNNDALL